MAQIFENIDNGSISESKNSIAVELEHSAAIATPIPGLTQEEIYDPNKVVANVVDKQAPIVVLFGPPASGKTMMLVRLTRYLKSIGYTVSPIRSFRPSYDANYKEMCDNYDIVINDTNAAQSTNKMSFMLVSVMKNGRCICQLLEAPGEHYFNPKMPLEGFPAYVNTIIHSSNRKIYCVMTEPDWKDQQDRSNYVTRIGELRRTMRPSDNAIFVLNKVDKTPFVIAPGQIHEAQALRQVEFWYPNIFVPFKNQNPITRFWKPYLCTFVPFQTGTYTKAQDGTMTYQEGPCEYPRKFWNVVLTAIKG